MLTDFPFPACRPRVARRLAVGDGHALYVEECGSASRLPVVFLHDGPGSGCRPEHRRLFDPRRFHAILFDQRGSGRSEPAGELDANTTPDLVADIEQVREALGIPAWIVFGNGWGSLLALSYAQLFPERVNGLVLCGIFLGTELELAGSDFGGFSPSTADAPAAARLRRHYLDHRCFIVGEHLLAGVGRLRHLPAVVIHGTDDAPPLPLAAGRLQQAWPEAIWMPLPGAGHDLLAPAVARAAVRGLEWVAECVLPV